MSFIISFGIPGFRDPVMPQIRDKVTTFFAYMQIFLHFFAYSPSEPALILHKSLVLL